MPATYTDRLQGLTTSVAVKPACRVATTGNISLSGLQTIDGVALASGDRVLVKNQASSSANGVYVANSWEWVRALDFDGSRDAVGGTQMMVLEGATNSNTYWRVVGSDDQIAIGTDGLTFEKALLTDSAVAAFFQSGAGAVLRSAQDKLRESPSVADYGAAGTGLILDNDAFTKAMTARDSIVLTEGTYLIKDLALISGRRLRGVGPKTILKFDPTGFRPLIMTGVEDLEITDLTLDCNGGLYDGMLFTTCQRVSLRNLWITGSAGYGITIDNCARFEMEMIRFYASGGSSSHAQIYLKNPTGAGSFNTIRNVQFRNIQGRGVFNLGNNFTQIYGLHGQMTNGEILLLQDTTSCVASNIVMAGAEPGAGALSDGIAINGNCFYNTISDFQISINSGHGVSINGQWEADGITPKTGASYNTVSNGVVAVCDEGGVIVTDQGVTGSVPAGNVISNVVVQNAGISIPSEAFGVSGGVDNQFINCTATDSQGVPTTTYGFKEQNGSNTAARNSFTGRLVGPFATGTFTRVASTTTVTLAGGRMVGTATYDPASLATGTSATTTVTVTGAALGMLAAAIFPVDLQGISVRAWVSAANTVSVLFMNDTGGTIDLGSATLTAIVTQP